MGDCGDTPNDTNTMCESGRNFQTTEHLLACPCIGEPGTNKDHTKATD